MIGKLLVHRPTREEAIATMLRCLEELQVGGIETTASFHKKVLTHPEFAAGTIDTKFVERTFKNSADQLLDSCIAGSDNIDLA